MFRSPYVSKWRDRFAAHRLDFLANRPSGILVATLAVARYAEVVDDDTGSLPGELERMRTPEAACSTGDDGNSSVQISHP